jgi:DNA-binding GntR family transcriptional regulator
MQSYSDALQDLDSQEHQLVAFNAMAGGPQTRRKQISQEVADYLRDAIMAGDLKADQFVRPERIAEQMMV